MKGYLLQYSGLENCMDHIVHGVTKSRTRLSDFHFHFTSRANLTYLLSVASMSVSKNGDYIKTYLVRVFPEVQRLRRHTSTAGAVGSIPGPWTKISHVQQRGQKHTNKIYLFKVVLRIKIGKSYKLTFPFEKLLLIMLSTIENVKRTNFKQGNIWPGLFLFFSKFYWNTVDLQCVTFTIAKLISYTYTYIHSFSDCFPIYVIAEYCVEFPVLYSKSLLVRYFIYSSAFILTPSS